jgi:hypothetical protein
VTSPDGLGPPRPPGRRAAVRFGTFDAERHWRPAGLARLPGLADPGADRVVAAMDELLAVGCAPGDVLITGKPVPPAFLDALGAAGLSLTHRVAPEARADPVPAGDPVPASTPVPAGRPVPAGEPVERRLLREPPTELRDWELRPYAVLDETAELARRHFPTTNLPGADVVRVVSSKTWSNEVAARAGLPGTATVVRTIDELAAALHAHAGAPVLLKDPYGVSGRGMVDVSSPGTAAAVLAALRRQADRGARIELLVQRRFDRVADFSAHAVVEPGGRVLHRGVLELENAGFRYAGSRSASPSLLRTLAGHGYDEHIATVAAALAAAGYHGPFCIDSMLLRDGTLVPVLEVNPRTSMGTLALDAAALAPRHRVRLAVRRLPLPGEAGDPATATHAYESALRELDDRGELLRAGRGGVLPLAVNTLVPPWGRLYCAVASTGDEDDRRLGHVVDAVADAVSRSAPRVGEAALRGA